MTPRFQILTRTHDFSEPPSMADGLWDIAVVCHDLKLEARSKAATDFAVKHSKTNFSVRFYSESNMIHVDGHSASFGKLRAKLAGVDSLMIEATSLSCPEILYVLAAAIHERVKRIRLLYVEPVEYRRRILDRLCDHRNFDLSKNRRYRAIQGFMTNLSVTPAGQAVFFLGYEGARLGQALEQEEMLRHWKKHVVFGVPAFESAWEIDSIANNVAYLSTGDQVQYAAASSVAAAYRLLCDLRKNDKESNSILVAPLGTKPHAIASALFLIEHNAMDQAILLYDHPERTEDRSTDVRRWHLYDVTDTAM